MTFKKKEGEWKTGMDNWKRTRKLHAGCVKLILVLTGITHTRRTKARWNIRTKGMYRLLNRFPFFRWVFHWTGKISFQEALHTRNWLNDGATPRLLLSQCILTLPTDRSPGGIGIIVAGTTATWIDARDIKILHQHEHMSATTELCTHHHQRIQ